MSGEETAKQVYKRIHGRPRVDGKLDGPDIGPLPEAGKNIDPEKDPKLFRKFLWDHIRFARSHAKHIPKKPKKRLSPEEEAELRWNLEMMVHQARYALGYLRKRDLAEEEDLGSHVKGGNCWHKSVVYNCRECGDGVLCDACHRHGEPRGDCSMCDPCFVCANEEPGEGSNG